jgi:predicted ester cyclase
VAQSESGKRSGVLRRECLVEGERRTADSGSGSRARGFMRNFPNMTVTFDKLDPRGDRTAFHWTLTGTYAGTGNHVRISAYELWKIDDVGLIAESSGHFDAAEYERQLKGGTRN